MKISEIKELAKQNMFDFVNKPKYHVRSSGKAYYICKIYREDLSYSYLTDILFCCFIGIKREECEFFDFNSFDDETSKSKKYPKVYKLKDVTKEMIEDHLSHNLFLMKKKTSELKIKEINKFFEEEDKNDE